MTKRAKRATAIVFSMRDSHRERWHFDCTLAKRGIRGDTWDVIVQVEAKGVERANVVTHLQVYSFPDSTPSIQEIGRCFMSAMFSVAVGLQEFPNG